MQPSASVPQTSQSAASRETSGVFNTVKNRLADIWNSETFDIYIPLRTWHNRLTYDRVSKYNEEPWGVGLGRSLDDEDGDTHMLYAMGFKDSNYQFQPIAGYAFTKNWRFGENEDWVIGLGYTLSITARKEYDYIPLPLPLPIASIGYKRFSVQCTYIPGGRNDGNVLFTWLRLQFN